MFLYLNNKHILDSCVVGHLVDRSHDILVICRDTDGKYGKKLWF